MTLLAALLACTPNHPTVISHRGLGVLPDTEENRPDHFVAAFEAGFGVELDLRLDGDGCDGEPERAALDGCFDLGHTEPNGHTLAEVVEAFAALDPALADRPLVLDIVNDPDRSVTLQLIPYLAAALPGTPLATTPLLLQSTSLDAVAMLEASRAATQPELDIRLAATYFADPELTVPDYVDAVVTNIAELPAPPLPVPVATFGVASQSSIKASLYAESDVRWIITDVPSRVADLID